jgi:hypothetical protein
MNYWRGPKEGVLSSFQSPLAVALRCYCPAESCQHSTESMKMCDFKRLTTITNSEMPVPMHIQNTLKKDGHVEFF